MKIMPYLKWSVKMFIECANISWCHMSILWCCNLIRKCRAKFRVKIFIEIYCSSSCNMFKNILMSHEDKFYCKSCPIFVRRHCKVLVTLFLHYQHGIVGAMGQTLKLLPWFLRSDWHLVHSDLTFHYVIYYKSSTGVSGVVLILNAIIANDSYLED